MGEQNVARQAQSLHISRRQIDPVDVEKNKTMAILAYFIFFLPLITKSKDSPYAKFHANQSLILFIFTVCGHIIAGFMPFFVSFLISSIIMIGSLVFWFMGVINAANGKMKKLPFIGGIHLLDEKVEWESKENTHHKTNVQTTTSQNAIIQNSNLSKYELQGQLKSVGVAFLMHFLFGAYFAYMGKWGMQLLFWFTLGGLGIWGLILLFVIAGDIQRYNAVIYKKIEEIEKRENEEAHLRQLEMIKAMQGTTR